MPKNKGFFDIDETEYKDIPEEPLKEETVQGDVAAKKLITPKTIIILLSAVMIVSAFFLIRWLYDRSDEDKSKYVPDEWLQIDTDKREPEIYLYTPDWETDIHTLPAYQALVEDIYYSPDGWNGIAVSKGSYVSVGGKGLKFMAEYVETIISGDHEKLNSLFTDEYFKDNKKYEAFPQQKIFDVVITKYNYSAPEYDYGSINDLYYIISYRIYRNDGLFRDDIDDVAKLPQLVKLLVYPDGSIKIDDVIDLPGYLDRLG